MSDSSPEPQPVTDMTNYVPNDEVPEYVSPDIAAARAGQVVTFETEPEPVPEPEPEPEPEEVDPHQHEGH
jgi:hypothetical protein